MKQLLFILILFCTAALQAQNLDIDLLRKINIDRNTALDPTFKFITNSVSPVGKAAPLLVLSVGFITKDKE